MVLIIIVNLFQVMHVLGFDPHAFAHFRDERKRRRNQVYVALCAVKISLIFIFVLFDCNLSIYLKCCFQA